MSRAMEVGAKRDGHRELPGGEERRTLASCGVVRVSLVNVAGRRPATLTTEMRFNLAAGVKILGFRVLGSGFWFLVFGFVVLVFRCLSVLVFGCLGVLGVWVSRCLGVWGLGFGV